MDIKKGAKQMLKRVVGGALSVSMFLGENEGSKVQRGFERLRLFLSFIVGIVPGMFWLVCELTSHQCWWSYFGRAASPMLWIAVVYGVMQTLFCGINWVINGFNGRTFSLVYKKKAMRQAILFVVIPLVLSMLCMGVKNHFELKAIQSFDWSKYERVK